MPKVSVIIPTYNYASYIVKAIDSILKQTYKDFEIIVVDDGSTDNTRELVETRYKDKIRYFYQENKGAPAARNMGILESRGEFCIFLDADDELGQNQILLFERHSRKNPNSIIYGPWTRFVERNGKYEQLYTNKKCKSDDMLASWLRGSWYIASCAIFWPKSMLNYLLGWDESLLINQDGDIAMRALIEGFNFYYCPEAYSFVRRHASGHPSLSRAVESKAILRSRLYLLRKIEHLLQREDLFEKYRNVLSESYYKLARRNVFSHPELSRLCYGYFKRLSKYGRPPGTILNWISVVLIGLQKKEKLAYWVKTIIQR
jgi:glycosyltransferase involved in cell wall biosynthesis